MTEACALSDGDLRVLSCLRSLLRAPNDRDREAVAGYSRDYMIHFLHAARSRWRFGFERPFGEIVEETADLEVAQILRVRPDAGDRPSLARLVRGLHGCIGCREPSADPVATVLAADDSALLFAFRKLLRMRAHQGAVGFWKQEHSEEALLLRALKLALRSSRAPRIQWDSRGQLVVGDSSDLRIRSMDQGELAAVLRGSGPALTASSVIKALRGCLRPSNAHGGYCYLLDLVRAIHGIKLAFIESDGDGTGAMPSAEHVRVTRSGVPMDLWIQRVREHLERTAREILVNDGGEASPATCEAWITIALERTLRSWGMGDPAWEHLSQAKLMKKLIPGTADEAAFAKSQVAIDYLIRRLRDRMRRNGKRYAQPLWQQWLETARRS